MTVKLHVKSGLEFRPDLYQSGGRAPWLEAVGKELESKGVSLKLGSGSNQIEIKTATDLVKLYDEYQSTPDAVAQKIGLPAGRELKEFFRDLIQALDDVVKDTSVISQGDKIDLTTTGELSKALGLDDKSVRYGSNRTTFGQGTPRPDGAMSVLGVRLSHSPQTRGPLDGVKYIDAATFAGGRLSTGRNGIEFETVRRLDGLTGADIVKLARTDVSGRSALARIRKAKDQEAFSLGYAGVGFDQMRWDSRAHRVREDNPYISFTIESGRLERDATNGEFEVTLGTDFFADTYYKAIDPTAPGRDVLEEADISVRGRIRYAEPGNPGRLLIQGKLGTEVDASGMKSAAKIDVRDDSPSADEIASMDEMVKTGMASFGWGSSQPRPVEAMQLIYQDLADKGLLPDVDGHEDVLILDRAGYVFSERGRYHLNETSTSAIKGLLDEGPKWIAEVKDLTAASTTLPQADKDRVAAMADALLDKSAILEAAREGLAALDPNVAPADITLDDINKLWPRAVSWGTGRDKVETRKRKVVADAIKSTYDSFSETFDDLRRSIAGTRDPSARSMRVYDELVEFVKSKEEPLRSYETPRKFLEHFDAKMAGPDKDAFIAEFGTWLKDTHNDATLADAPDAAAKDALMAGLRMNLVDEHLDILHRQIEASGTSAKTLWFDDARNTYADIDRQTWNFLIDTFDFVQHIKPSDWDSLTPEQRDGREPIPVDKITDADLISEVQIELGYEKPYTEALAKAKAALVPPKAGLFMDFALAEPSANVVADQPATFTAFRDSLTALDESGKTSLLEKLNAFAASKGSPLTYTLEDVASLPESAFTTANQGQPTDGHADLKETLEMTNFIWNSITGAQEYIADLRGRRVVGEAADAGFRGLDWVKSTESKGEKNKRVAAE